MGVAETMAEKNYLDLKREVWDRGLCAGCGACVAVCPQNQIHFDAGDDQSHPVHAGYCKEVNDEVPCGACYAVCPRIEPPPEHENLLGDYAELTAGKASFDVPGKQSGGAVTAILLSALEEDVIDAVVTVAEDRWTRRPSSVVITASDVLIHQAGSRYNWWVPLVAALKEAVITRKYRRVAVVGVPCVVRAVQKMRESDHQLLRPFRRSVRLVIGLFCTESFDYQRLVEEKLGKEYQIEPWQIRQMNVKGKLEVTLSDGTVLPLPLAQLEACVRPGCHFCTDLTALDADISAGAVGSPDGYTTLLIRTSTGRGFVDGAVRAGKLDLRPEVDRSAIERLASQKKKRRSNQPLP
jgi:coenzyme F420 hydrogenase subunit beta